MGSVLKVILSVIVVLAFLAYSPTLLDINPEIYKPNLPKILEGALEFNNKLDARECLLNDLIDGPESFAYYEGNIYTGTQSGHIVRITDNQVFNVARIGKKDCEGPWQQTECGRPLGVRIGRDGKLYTTDAYYGINSVDLNTGAVEQVLPNTIVEGKQVTFPDDLDIDSNGNIYFSDASTKWTYNECIFNILEHSPTGRVLKFNPKTKEVNVIMNNLYFPNGVQLTHDGGSLLVCEHGKNRILRFYLKGRKKGQTEVFIDKLPGEPDNIRPSSSGGYWTAVVFPRNMSSLSSLDYMANHPLLRKVISRLLYTVGSVMEIFSTIISFRPLKEFSYKMKNGFYVATYGQSAVIEIDKTGKVIRSLYSSRNKIGFISEALELNGNLYLGSFINPFVARIRL